MRFEQGYYFIIYTFVTKILFSAATIFISAGSEDIFRVWDKDLAFFSPADRETAMSNKWKLTAIALVFAAAASMASSAFAQGFIEEYGPPADPRVWQYGPAAGRIRPADFDVVPTPPYGWYGTPLAGGSIGYEEHLRKDKW